MNDTLLDGISGKRANHRRGFHEIRPGSDDVEDFHFFFIPMGNCFEFLSATRIAAERCSSFF